MPGIIAINSYAAPARQSERLQQELAARGVQANIMRVGELKAAVINSRTTVADCDFCLYLDKDKYTARILELSGIRLFNSASAIEVCDDKMLTHIALANAGIPMPDTLPGPLCYDASAPLDALFLDRVEAALGYPLVIKQSYGSLGKGVFKADDRRALEKITSDVRLYPHLYQKYIASSFGRDLRVIVVGGKVLGGILRTSDGSDFRSNIGLGGSAKKIDVPSEVTAAALDAARALKLDYCGMDFLFGDNGYLLCEVNSNAFFDAFEAATGINVAGEYASYIVNALRAS